MTYKDIEKANMAITPLELEHKNRKTGKATKNFYAQVKDRVKAFRMCYPEGAIITEMLSNENGVCVFRAEVYATYKDTYDPYGDEYVHERVLLATGTAFESQKSSYINETSYIENCETSAIGRALGYVGFGIDTSIASAEEVQNAQIQRDLNAPATAVERKALTNVMQKLGKTYDDLETLKNLKRGDTLTYDLYLKAMKECGAQ
jgi:hypothetical protein